MTQPGFLWTILFFLVAIGPLIFLHELGHYLVARWCGVRSEVFSIGFGREVAGWTDRRGTRWKVGWLPLGGYVRFAGDMNAASMPDAEWVKLPEAERGSTFPAQPIWKRALIVAAGPVTNLLVAFFIFMGIAAAVGERQAPNVIGTLSNGSAAERAGFLPGDRVIAIDSRTIAQFSDIGNYVELRPNQLMTFQIERAGQPRTIIAAPSLHQETDRFGNVYRIGRMGMASAAVEMVKVPVTDLPGSAYRQVRDVLRTTVDALGQIFTGQRSAKELGGPLMIAKVSGQIATIGWVAFMFFMAGLSINLGFINLLPIPMLDGGHLFFYAVESVIRRPVPPQAQEWAFRSGAALLFGLMLFVTFNDLGRFGMFGSTAG